MHRYRKAIEWLRNFEVPLDTVTGYTHSSLRGGRDPTTRTGRIQVPDDPRFQKELATHIASLYDAHEPATLVEMSTNHFPFVEDIDIEATMGGTNQPGIGPPDRIVHNPHDHFRFWRFRALSLHRLFPKSTLRLVLYSASGKHNEKGCFKTSFHCVWPDLIVDRERAHQVRLSTIDSFADAASRPRVHGGDDDGEWAAQLLERLVASAPPGAAASNSFESLFDITGVRAGSLRMPLCDKVVRDAPGRPYEGRPIQPVGEIEFEFSSPAGYGTGRGAGRAGGGRFGLGRGRGRGRGEASSGDGDARSNRPRNLSSNDVRMRWTVAPPGGLPRDVMTAEANSEIRSARHHRQRSRHGTTRSEG